MGSAGIGERRPHPVSDDGVKAGGLAANAGLYYADEHRRFRLRPP